MTKRITLKEIKQDLEEIREYCKIFTDNLKIMPISWGFNSKEGKHIELMLLSPTGCGMTRHAASAFINEEQFNELIKIGTKLFSKKTKFNRM